ncbi:MAG: DVU_1551 family NTP transferase [Thermovirgaceae bacterium]
MNNGLLKTGAVILAAGFSSRMGRCKALLDIEGASALRKASLSMHLAGVGDLVVVTGCYREDVELESARYGIRTVFNEHFEKGMFSSVQTGTAAISQDMDAFFLLPVDIPLIRPATYTALREAFLQNKNTPVVIPSFRGRMGHPPLISSELIPEILEWSGDGGLRALLDRHRKETLILEVPDEGTVLEMDTPEEYEALRSFAAKSWIPSKTECLAFLEMAGTPEEVREHCFAVARVVKRLASHLKNLVPANCRLLEAAALLHDMARTRPDHAERAAAIVEKWGFPETADLIRYHMNLPEGEPLLSNRSLLYLADKLTSGKKITNLEQKQASAENRFYGNPPALEAVSRRMQRAGDIAGAFEKCTEKSLDSILDSL